MKLRTGRLTDMRGDDATIHDAAAAHALMQAIDDGSEAAGFDVGWWIKTRADSILRQWGFDSGEEE